MFVLGRTEIANPWGYFPAFFRDHEDFLLRCQLQRWESSKFYVFNVFT